MKIVFLCNLVPDKSGSFEAFVCALGHELSERGDELVAVFAGDPVPEVEQDLQLAKVRWYAVKDWEGPGRKVKPWGIVLPALRILKRESPDLVAVHFGNELPAAALIILARIFVSKRIKWVWHQRQQIKDPSLGLDGKINRLKILSLVCDHFVALYKFGRESLLYRSIPDRKISVIVNGVGEYRGQKPADHRPYPKLRNVAGEQQTIDNRPGSIEQKGTKETKGDGAEGGSRGCRKELGLSEDDYVITNVSSLIPRKRLDVTLRAFAEAKQKLLKEARGGKGGTGAKSHLKLILVGDGSERERLVKMSEELGIRSDVLFLGARNDVRDVLSVADLMILTSDAEACPMVVLEAMSVGLPCIATEAGASKELISNGTTGFVVQRGAFEDIAAHIYELLTDENMRSAMSQAGLKRWKEKYTLSDMVKKHVELYRNTVTGDK